MQEEHGCVSMVPCHKGKPLQQGQQPLKEGLVNGKKDIFGVKATLVIRESPCNKGEAYNQKACRIPCNKRFFWQNPLAQGEEVALNKSKETLETRGDMCQTK